MSEPDDMSVNSAAPARITRLAVPVTDRDHAQGEAGAPVTLVEYGDYECPYCGRAYPLIRALQKELGNKLRFVFRNFPLNTIHRHASIAAQAAECAAAQRKFWEMHDLLYEHQGDLSEVDLHRYALRIGLEIYRFDADLSGEVFAHRVREDFEGGVRSGVNGTPALFINERRYGGGLTRDAMRDAIEQAAPDLR